jgi:hypothetical protein
VIQLETIHCTILYYDNFHEISHKMYSISVQWNLFHLDENRIKIKKLKMN